MWEINCSPAIERDPWLLHRNFRPGVCLLQPKDDDAVLHTRLQGELKEDRPAKGEHLIFLNLFICQNENARVSVYRIMIATAPTTSLGCPRGQTRTVM